MDAVHFDQETTNFGAPPGFTKDEVFDLPVCQSLYFIRNFHPVANLISCWQLSDEDWMQWKPNHYTDEDWMGLKPKDPKIWLSIMGVSMPVVSLGLENPFPSNYNKAVGKYLHDNGKLPADFQAEVEEMRKQHKPKT